MSDIDRNEVITLIKAETGRDDYGMETQKESVRTVFANVKSVGSKEFFEAGQNGLQPQYQFTMFAPDYDGERMIGYKGGRYAVYRTYQKTSDLIELYVEERAGV